MNCPKCHSENVRVELRHAGTVSHTNFYKTGVRHSWFIPSGMRSRKSSTKQKSVALCQDCGYVWEPNKSKLGLIVAVCFVVLLIIGILTPSSENPTEPDAGETEAAVSWEYAPLVDFEYYIDNESLYLKKYTGHQKTVNIAAVYEVDNRELPVVELDGTFVARVVDCVIVPEGVTRIVANSFNSCGVSILYLPSTLKDFTGWSYFHDVEKIYYGGDETTWTTLYTGERSRLDVVEVIYNASIADITG